MNSSFLRSKLEKLEMKTETCHPLLALSLLLMNNLLALELPVIFADQMILQREQPVPIWGTAKAGEQVTVHFADQKKSTIASDDGKWRIDLDPLKASSQSRTLTITTPHKDTLTYSDVLVGEVWFAGGQSNMYRPFRMLTSPANDPFYEPVTEYLRNERDTANDPLFRQYRASQVYKPYEAETIGRGKWSKAIPGEVNEFCGTAYFFGRELRRELNVPVALISCNKGGTIIEAWIPPQEYESTQTLKTFYERGMVKLKKEVDSWDEETETARYREALAQRKQALSKGEKVPKKEPKKPENPLRNPSVPGTLFNGMVHPVAPYGMRGVIWYQGESNSGNDPKEYRNRLQALIEGWRSTWGQEKLPFYWCQLANYKPVTEEPLGDEVHGWVWVQNGQREALQLPDTGMAVLNDIGKTTDVHPKNKIDAGKRLSLWALSKVYDRDLVYSGPLYKEAKVIDHTVLITFEHSGSGLMVGKKHLMNLTTEAKEPLQRFQICGPDGEWKWAQAEITAKNTVTVWHEKIPKPLEVRYAWAPNPEGANLYNKEGLPTSVFKTGKLQ